MARNKKPLVAIDIGNLGQGLDDVYDRLNPDAEQKKASKPVKTTASSQEGAEPPAAPPVAESSTRPPVAARAPKKAAAKRRRSPGKEKSAAASSASVPSPESRLGAEDLEWFFTHVADTSSIKQLYVGQATKEVLHQVAKSAGIPGGHLADNILRWFLWAHKNDIKKFIARHGNSLDRLDM